MNLLRPFDLATFAALLQSAPPGIVADWLVGDVQAEPVDVCLLYARDAAACEGLPRYQCPGCGSARVNHERLCTVFRCPCGRETNYADAPLDPAATVPMLPCEFPQAHFAAWAGQVYGVGRGAAATAFTTGKDGGTMDGRRWWAGEPPSPIPDYNKTAWHHTRPAAVRDLKRRTLRLFPEVAPEMLPNRFFRAEALVPPEPAHGLSATEPSPQEVEQVRCIHNARASGLITPDEARDMLAPFLRPRA